MKKQNLSAGITLWVNRVVAVLLAATMITLPAILDWYETIRHMGQWGRETVLIAFYCCSVVIAVALWNMDALLRSILKGQVFIRRNVQRISWIRYCCGAVSLICIPAAVAYPPLVFLTVIMAFLCLAVSVVASVMNAAVAIREENDLTI